MNAKSVSRNVIIILATLVVALLAASAVPAYAYAGVKYVERSWDGSQVVSTEKECNSYKVIDEDADDDLNGWYVVNGNVTIDSGYCRLKVSGTANIILCDGAKLTLDDGIEVTTGNTLNIYGQWGDSGELYCHSDNNDYAAIGSNDQGGDCGAVNIHGGKVTADAETQGTDAAGIGGGQAGNGGDVAIYGGTVIAKGADQNSADGGAGIGGGDRDGGKGGNGGTCKIYGGYVEAYGGWDGAGIGGGDDGDGGLVEIYGGTVKATGDDGAGIGGGQNGNAGTVRIYGGDVTATGGTDAAGIGGGEKGNGGTINVSGENAKVTAQGGNNGAGIGGGDTGAGGTITIMAGTVSATGGSVSTRGGAGIGGGGLGAGGTINIGGSANITKAQGGANAAGIGGGDEGEGGNITISGGTVNATGGSIHYEGGAGIGGGNMKTGGTIHISNCTIIAKGGEDGAAIGGGNQGAGGSITIEDATVNATAGKWAAGIGGGQEGDGGTITIGGENTSVTAIGGDSGAGIGGGQHGKSGVIEIRGGSVTATGNDCLGTDGGAGIGGGSMADGEKITISGGTVTAQGGKCAAGIGGGYHHGNGIVTITGGQKIKATGGKSGAGIGAGDVSVHGKIEITGGVIEAQGGEYAAGIGGGNRNTLSTGGTIVIGGTADITATGGKDAAGVGGGEDTTGGTITISGGTIKAYGGTDDNTGGAGIGGGEGAGGGDITIEGGAVEAVGGANAAGIGNGNGGGERDEQGNGGPANITLSYNDDSRGGIAVKASSYRYSDSDTSVTVTMQDDFKDKSSGAVFAAKEYKGDELNNLKNRILVCGDTYRVTVAATPTGIVGVDKIRAAEGETVTLTVPTDNGYVLTPGSLKASFRKNGDTEITPTPVEGDPLKFTFPMPAASVTVSAEIKKKVDVTKVELDKTELELAEKESQTVKAELSPNDTDETAVVKTVTWTSSDTGVATVDEAGVVTGVVSGEAIITATATNGTEDTADDKTATCAVTVTAKLANTLAYDAVQSVEKTFSTSSQTEALKAASGGQGVVTYAIVSQEDASGNDVEHFGLDTTTPTLTLAANIPAGVYTVVVRATAAGDTDYNSGMRDSTVTVTVGKLDVAAPTIASKVYNGQKQIADIATNELYTVANEGGTDVGAYDVVLTLTDPANYKWPDIEEAAKTLKFQITKAALTDVKVENVELAYTGKAQTPEPVTSATSVGDQEVSFTYSATQEGDYGTMPSFTGIGSSTVYFKASAPNHEDASGSFTVTMGKGQNGITVSLDSWASSESAKSPTVKADEGAASAEFEYKAKDAPDSAYSKDVPTEIGAYTVRASIGETQNYKAGSATADFAINPVATIDLNGGTGGNDTEVVEYGTAFTLPAAGAYTAPAGMCRIASWEVAVGSGAAKNMAPGDTVAAMSNITLKATWEGHDWGEPTYEWASDNKRVVATRVCKHDGSHKETETANANSKVAKLPTCDSKGETTYTAAFENTAFVAQAKTVADVDPLGHEYGAWTKLDDEQHQRVCARDAAHVEKSDHTWDAGKVTKEPTATETGVRTYTCTACKATRTEVVPTVPEKASSSAAAEGQAQAGRAAASASAAKLGKPKVSTSGHNKARAFKVSWTKVSGAKSYQVQWRERGGKWKSVKVKSRAATVKGMKKGRLYDVRVRAVAGKLKGAWSTQSHRWFVLPTSVKAKRAGAGAVKVTWSKMPKANAGYLVVVRYSKAGETVAKRKVAAGKTSVTVKGLKAGKKAWVHVRALRKAGNTTYTGILMSAKSSVKVTGSAVKTQSAGSLTAAVL